MEWRPSLCPYCGIRLNFPLSEKSVVCKICRRTIYITRYESKEAQQEDSKYWTAYGKLKQEMGQNMNQLLPVIKPTYIGTDTSIFVQKQVQEALTAYNKALSIDTRNASAWNNKGTLLALLGLDTKAITCYNQALEIDASDPLIYRNKGFSLIKLERWKEALACYDRALELQPKDVSLWNWRSVILVKLGCLKKALAAVRKALEIDPTDHTTLYNERLLLDKLQYTK
jgi:tetratricopeptide (TPR) repeat protein